MKVLGIDTSSTAGGCALYDSNIGVVGQLSFNLRDTRMTHSEHLMPSIDYLLRMSCCAIADIDVFAVTTGPGSFTGLRVGLSTVKGFSFVSGRPITAVSTLDSLAWNFPFCALPICAIIDARKDEVYCKVFKWDDNGPVEVNNLGVCTINEALGGIKARALFTGNAVLSYRDRLLAATGDKAVLSPDDKLYPYPAVVACLGFQMAMRGDFVDPALLKPVYLKDYQGLVRLSE